MDPNDAVGMIYMYIHYIYGLLFGSQLLPGILLLESIAVDVYQSVRATCASSLIPASAPVCRDPPVMLAARFLDRCTEGGGLDVRRPLDLCAYILRE